MPKNYSQKKKTQLNQILVYKTINNGKQKNQTKESFIYFLTSFLIFLLGNIKIFYSLLNLI